MEEHREELALLDTYETGRCFKNYYNDSIPKAIECIRYFAEAIDKAYDTAIPARGSEFGAIVRKPLGVVGLITPWNDPMVVDSWKFTPALLMGNSVVIKPAEQSALSLIYLAKLTKEAGLVHINSYGNDDNSAPFGGIKESGIGKDKSAFVFDEFSYQKTIWMHFGE